MMIVDQIRVVWFDRQRKPEVRQRVFMAAVDLEVWRECRELFKRFKELGRRAFERPSTPDREQCVARKQPFVVKKGNMAGGVSRDVEYPERGREAFDPNLISLGHRFCHPGDGFPRWPVYRHGGVLYEPRNAAAVVPVMVCAEHRSDLQSPLLKCFSGWIRVAGVNHNRRASGRVKDEPDVVVAKGGDV